MPDVDLKRYLREPALLAQFLGSDFPHIASAAQLDDRVCLELQVTPDLRWFLGHFPGQPVLPGVIQLHWAVQASSALFGLAGQPRRLKRLKFSNVVVPPRVVELVLERHGDYEVQFLFRSEGQQHSQGRIVFPGDGA